MRSKSFAWCLLLTYLLTPAWAVAEEEEDEYSEKNWIATIEFGVLLTSGNTEKRSLKGKLDATQDLPKWRNTYQLEAFNSEDSERTTAERYKASSQSDFKLLDERKYLFWRISGIDDRFSGYEYEVTSTIGYGFRAWEKALPYNDENAYLDLEAGPGYRLAKIKQSQLRDGEDDNERAGIIRFAGKYIQPLSNNARFSQTLSTEISVVGSDNMITESESALTANLMGSFAMKLALNIRHIKEPPQGKKQTDTESSITLIYSL